MGTMPQWTEQTYSRGPTRHYLLVASFCLIGGCANPTPKAVTSQVLPTPLPRVTGTVIAIRLEVTDDPTGALRQIMSILGQPSPAPGAEASEYILRLPADMIKAGVQRPDGRLAIGSNAAIDGAAEASIQPY